MLGYIISDKNKINVEEHEIFSFDILHKTNLNIYVIKNNKIVYKNYIIENACKYEHIQVLEWFKNSGYEFKFYESQIFDFLQYGNKWFKNHGYELRFDCVPIYCAAANGNTQVLEWFKNSGYKINYNSLTIEYASYAGHIEILEWFKNSGYEFKYNKAAFTNKFIKILKFFSNNFNIKKLIKWSDKIIFTKTIKFKTHHKYLKGYQKN
jgi:hypothetical protein